MPNRLAQQTSPYLRQHADNPVDWYPWGEEALARARRENKPILLSIGYSACHWCHVMAQESFEDAEVAALMNRLFVNVKVDREERPDLDQIYQLAHQMMTQRGGGWPLTVFLTPQQEPFFAGTYFPRQSRYNLMGFADLCRRVGEVWREQRAELERHALQLRDALAQSVPQGDAEPVNLTAAPLAAGLAAMKKTFDRDNGGFGAAPKFPHPSELEFCLRRHAASADAEALHIVSHTLERMARGGIFDQIGGGFARYSVDARWTIPHFEKMLCDNAHLLRLYADAWALTGNGLFARVVERTAGWIMREMQSPLDREGGYYSSLDADSEHQEGKYYVWAREEIRGLLADEEYAVAAAHYGLEGSPNFENRCWHLNVDLPLAAVAQRLGLPLAVCAESLDSARAKLFAARDKRVRPGRDDKVLTSWNALAIAGMARAGHVFARADWVDSASRAMNFVRRVLWREDRLLATCKDGRAHLNAYLDDHAYLLAAAIELLQVRFERALHDFALQLGEVLLARFEDPLGGGFFFTSNDHERLLARMKPLYDGAQPSGNGVAMLALTRLTHLSGDARFAAAAEKALRAHWNTLEQAPNACASMLMALEEQLVPTRTVILRGPAAAVDDWKRHLARLYLPHGMVLAVYDGIGGLPEVLAKPSRGEVNAWVCEGVICLEPVSRLEDLLELVSKCP